MVASGDWFSFAMNEKKVNDAWMKENIKKVRESISKEQMCEDTSDTTDTTGTAETADSAEWFSFGLKNSPQIVASRPSRVTEDKEVMGSEWFSFASYSAEKKAQINSPGRIAEEFNNAKKNGKSRKTDFVEWYSVASHEGVKPKPSHATSRVKPTDRVDWFSVASQQ